ncbi:hypothetical protein FA10DRAFT_289499 [Acaromyces ingoldii]|uniref:Uncharacterized protein n=1 Tax=Acaromyces ingoldii TaxID=215250 RepID=A0A316YCC4_9BASI|nr:hypothetical protein FA10DRAFT_289499 [Acaromyces ingoldii]PWN86922.1 hypothetical protein FA10DRAFT_289499 [Acaromyces ingoldii]
MSYLTAPLHPRAGLTLPSDTIVGIPAIAALNLASSLVDALEKKLKAGHSAKEEADGEDAAQDLFEDYNDVCTTQHSIDPATWAANRAKEGRKAELEETNATTQQRLEQFLQLAFVPKAKYVIEDAIKLHKETRPERAEDAAQRRNEDALLDFISHLSIIEGGFYLLKQ